MSKKNDKSDDETLNEDIEENNDSTTEISKNDDSPSESEQVTDSTEDGLIIEDTRNTSSTESDEISIEEDIDNNSVSGNISEHPELKSERERFKENIDSLVDDVLK